MVRFVHRAGAILALVFIPTSFQAQSSGSGIAVTVAERLGGQGVVAMAPDGNGNIWIVGDASFNAIPVTADAAQPMLRGSQDAYLMKIRADGTVAYASYLGGSNSENGLGVATDPAGNVYVVGRTNSADFPVSAGAFSAVSHGDDGFLTKFASDGRSVLYSTYIPGTFIQSAAVGADASGRAHVTGMTLSTNFPTTETIAANGDVFYMRFGVGGGLEYSTRIGGSGGEQPNGIAVDGGGNAYIVGSTSSRDFTLRRALKSTFPATSGGQAFLAKFTPAGLDFSTFIGGSGSDNMYAIAVSPTGVYVGGQTCSWDFPGTSNPNSTPSGCDGAAVIAKLQLDGSAYLASLLLNGSSYDDGILGLSVDADDHVYAFGTTLSTDFPVTQDAQQIASAGAQDAFFAKLSMPDATHLHPDYVTYFGGGSGDRGRAAVADGAGGAWAGGWTNSADWPTLSSSNNSSQSVVAHFAVTGATAPPSDDIVLYAKDATITGNWQVVADNTAAGGARIWNPDAGAAKIGTASAAPANYFDMTFHAQAGVAYHLWLRMKADNDSWNNDSVFVQLSEATDNSGIARFDIGTSNAAVVSLEDCTGCGEQGWGWNDNGYGQPGMLIKFTTTGTHTIRVQQREDGISIDQIVLSSRTWINTAPGANKNDSTIVPQGSAPPPPPPPPPPPGTLPSAWSHADIGAVGQAGSAAYDSASGTFTLTGAGADVWGTADAFQYAHTTLTGDGTIVARVASVSAGAAWIKAGVMLRDTTDPSSAHAFMLVSYGKGTAFQRRVSAGGVSTSTTGGAFAAPWWVKLERQGNTFIASQSADGISWNVVGSDTIAMGSQVLAGLAVSSHTTSASATATFDHVSITTTNAPPPPPPPSGDQCSSLTLSQTSFYSGGPASSWQITVTAPSATCTWTASIDQSWLVLNGAAGPATISGTGSGKVTLETLDNQTGSNRYATFTIGGTAYKVTQEPF